MALTNTVTESFVRIWRNKIFKFIGKEIPNSNVNIFFFRVRFCYSRSIWSAFIRNVWLDPDSPLVVGSHKCRSSCLSSRRRPRRGWWRRPPAPWPLLTKAGPVWIWRLSRTPRNKFRVSQIKIKLLSLPQLAINKMSLAGRQSGYKIASLKWKNCSKWSHEKPGWFPVARKGPLALILNVTEDI